jgi:hypothetical protein
LERKESGEAAGRQGKGKKMRKEKKEDKGINGRFTLYFQSKSQEKPFYRVIF